MTTDSDFDPVDRPRHYNIHPSGIQPIEWIENMRCPNLANAAKYVARYAEKNNPVEDLGKAMWYIAREVKRRSEYVIAPAPAKVPFYSASDAKFYAYIAAEPHPNVREILILLYNGDLEGSGEQYNLPAAADTLMHLTKAVEQHLSPPQTVDGGDIPLNAEYGPVATPAVAYADMEMLVRDFAHVVGTGSQFEDGAGFLQIEGDWKPIVDVRRVRGNKYRIGFLQHVDGCPQGSSLSLNPTERVRVRLRKTVREQ